MATEATLTTYLDAARSAISGGDLAAARTQVALAKTVLAELPDISADGVSQRYGNAIRALESALSDAAKAIAPSRGRIGRTRVGGV